MNNGRSRWQAAGSRVTWGAAGRGSRKRRLPPARVCALRGVRCVCEEPIVGYAITLTPDAWVRNGNPRQGDPPHGRFSCAPGKRTPNAARLRREGGTRGSAGTVTAPYTGSLTPTRPLLGAFPGAPPQPPYPSLATLLTADVSLRRPEQRHPGRLFSQPIITTLEIVLLKGKITATKKRCCYPGEESAGAASELSIGSSLWCGLIHKCEAASIRISGKMLQSADYYYPCLGMNGSFVLRTLEGVAVS